MQKYDLFISYSSKDKSFVHQLAHDLKTRGLYVWLDAWEMMPGDRLRDRILEGITRSHYMLFVLSPNSIDSPWVKIELDSGMIKELENEQVVVIPVIIGNISPKLLPLDLRGKLYLDFNDNALYDANLTRIMQRFKNRESTLPYEYEILLGENIIELLDSKGEQALITKRKIIKVLAEKLVFNHEEYYADGKVDSFECDPGSITSITHTIGKIEVINDFGRELFRGDEFEQTIKCLYHKSFMKDKEYWITWQAYPNKISKYLIVFPIDRPPKKSRCKVKTGIYERDYERQPQQGIFNDLPCLFVEVEQPRINDYHKVEWEW